MPESTVDQESKNGTTSTKSCEVDYLSKSSKTDDEKLEEMNFLINAETGEKHNELCSNANNSKSDDEKLSENKKCDNSVINNVYKKCELRK